SRLLEWKRISHGKTKRVFRHGLGRLVDGVGGGRDHADVLLLQLGPGLFEGSQLLLAVWSPVRAVQQQHAPSAVEGGGDGEPSVGDRLHGERRELVAAVENPRSGSRHCQLRSILFVSYGRRRLATVRTRISRLMGLAISTFSIVSSLWGPWKIAA